MLIRNISEIQCNTALYEKIFIDVLPFIVPEPTGDSKYDAFVRYAETELYNISRKKTGLYIIGINTSMEMSTRINKKWLSSNQSDLFLSAINIIVEKNNNLEVDKFRLLHWIKEYGIPESMDTKTNVFAYFPSKDKYSFCGYIPMNKFCNSIKQLYCCFNLWEAALNNDKDRICKYSKMLKSDLQTADEVFSLLSYIIEKRLKDIRIKFRAIPEFSLFFNEASSIYSLLFYQLACRISCKDNTRIRLRACEKCGEMFYSEHGNDKYCGKYTGKRGCNKSAAYMKKVRSK